MIEKILLRKSKRRHRIILLFAVIMLATIIGYAFKILGFPETNVVIVYLLAIQVLAWLSDDIPLGIIASILSTLTFNYFFTEPYFTLSVHDSSYIITFVIMTISSIITSALTSLAKKNALIAHEKEEETRALYKLTNQLTDADRIETIASIVVKTLSEYLSQNIGMICYDENGFPEHSFIQQLSSLEQVRRELDDVNQFKYRIESLRTSYDENTEFFDWPIYGREDILGVIRIPNVGNTDVNQKNFRFLHSTIESVAIAMDRIRVTEQRVKDREENVQERYRSTLLRSISHDLRTPLSSIMGTSEVLLDMKVINASEDCYTLVESIYNDSKWLYSLVENILSLTRLQEGKLVVGKQLEVVEEVISSVIERFSVRGFAREIDVKAPSDPILVPMDAKLIEQVLINLLDNAYKHTSSNDEISIIVELDKHISSVKFIIRDCGVGILEDDLPHILELFYTSTKRTTYKKNSLGLGLPICDAIIKAHGGTFMVSNRRDSRGAEAVFTLPLEVDENE